MMRKLIAIGIALLLLLAFLWLSWIEGMYDNAVLDENVKSGIELNKLETQCFYKPCFILPQQGLRLVFYS